METRFVRRGDSYVKLEVLRGNSPSLLSFFYIHLASFSCLIVPYCVVNV